MKTSYEITRVVDHVSRNIDENDFGSLHYEYARGVLDGIDWILGNLDDDVFQLSDENS